MFVVIAGAEALIGRNWGTLFKHEVLHAYKRSYVSNFKKFYRRVPSEAPYAV